MVEGLKTESPSSGNWSHCSRQLATWGPAALPGVAAWVSAESFTSVVPSEKFVNVGCKIIVTLT